MLVGIHCQGVWVERKLGGDSRMRWDRFGSCRSLVGPEDALGGILALDLHMEPAAFVACN